MLTATVTSRSRLNTPEQFRRIVLKTQPDGARVTLQDVARVELGAENYSIVSRFNGYPAAGLAVQLAPGADALKTAELVKAELVRQTPSFPEGYKYAFPLDSTTFIRLSVDEVIKTLIEAIVLVVIVMFVVSAELARDTDPGDLPCPSCCSAHSASSPLPGSQ